MAETRVYKAVCPYCKKEINSLNEEQLKYNYDTHRKACRLKRKKK